MCANNTHYHRWKACACFCAVLRRCVCEVGVEVSRTLRDRLRGVPLRCYTNKPDDTLTDRDRQRTINTASSFREVDKTKTRARRSICFPHTTGWVHVIQKKKKKITAITSLNLFPASQLLEQRHSKCFKKKQVVPDPWILFVLVFFRLPVSCQTLIAVQLLRYANYWTSLHKLSAMFYIMRAFCSLLLIGTAELFIYLFQTHFWTHKTHFHTTNGFSKQRHEKPRVCGTNSDLTSIVLYQ